ncbi:MAG: hypothetical protein JSS83_15650 [Cyanobacteria bacterium SZAS LIN-3]|nr:hypothetical protein [Cyanobacteria bacterium SZAS LIN-3]
MQTISWAQPAALGSDDAQMSGAGEELEAGVAGRRVLVRQGRDVTAAVAVGQCDRAVGLLEAKLVAHALLDLQVGEVRGQLQGGLAFGGGDGDGEMTVHVRLLEKSKLKGMFERGP